MSRWRWGAHGLQREAGAVADADAPLLTLRARDGVARGALRPVTGWDWFQDRPVTSSWAPHVPPIETSDAGDSFHTFALEPHALYLVEVCGARDLKELSYLTWRPGEGCALLSTRDAPALVFSPGGELALEEAVEQSRWTLAWAIASAGGEAARASVLAGLADDLRLQATGPLAGSATQSRQAESLRDSALGLLRAALRALRPRDASADALRFALLTAAFNLRAIDRARTLFRVRYAIQHGELGALVWAFADNGRRLSELERRVASVDCDELDVLLG